MVNEGIVIPPLVVVVGCVVVVGAVVVGCVVVVVGSVVVGSVVVVVGSVVVVVVVVVGSVVVVVVRCVVVGGVKGAGVSSSRFNSTKPPMRMASSNSPAPPQARAFCADDIPVGSGSAGATAPVRGPVY